MYIMATNKRGENPRFFNKEKEAVRHAMIAYIDDLYITCYDKLNKEWVNESARHGAIKLHVLLYETLIDSIPLQDVMGLAEGYYVMGLYDEELNGYITGTPCPYNHLVCKVRKYDRTYKLNYTIDK